MNIFPIISFIIIISSTLLFPQNNQIGNIFAIEKATPLFERCETQDKITHLLVGDTVKLLNDVGYYCRVLYKDTSGYIYRSSITIALDSAAREKKRQSDMLDLLQQQREAAVLDSINLAETSKRWKRLVKSYGKVVAQRIVDRKIWLNMSKKMVEESWGKPDDIHRQVGPWGVHENWIYGGTYLYFENGKLSSWQD